MQLKFYKLYPMGNCTVLVDNLEAEIDKKQYIRIANILMQDDFLACEQVGFITRSDGKSDYKLEMMGGELCVNALRSLGYLNFIKTKKKHFLLSSSGTDGIFKINVEGKRDEVSLDFKMKIEHVQLTKSLSLVSLDGISHFIEDIPSVKLTEELILNRHSELNDKYSELVKGVEAIGYIPYQRDDESGSISITPLVYVVHTDTKIFESACGSGTIAVGVHEFNNDNAKTNNFSIVQPSKAIFKLKIDSEDKLNYNVAITSEVYLVAEGSVYVNI